jgi:hypothetical protein
VDGGLSDDDQLFTNPDLEGFGHYRSAHQQDCDIARRFDPASPRANPS